MNQQKNYLYISKHKNHHFTKEYEETFKELSLSNNLTTRNLRFETLKLIDRFIDSYYYKRTELETKISDLENQIKMLLEKIDQMNDNFLSLTSINVTLQKQLLDTQQELYDTINGIADD
jgi:hypothetical protein